MTKYEFDFEVLKLTEEQTQVIQMGLGNIEALSFMIRDVINARAAEGWEPMYPFSVPNIWFRRVLASRTVRKKKIIKKS